MNLESNFARVLLLATILLAVLSEQATFADSEIAAGAKSVDAVPVDRFETDIRAFEEKDRKSTPPTGGTVFVGSSTFTRWDSLEKTFSEFKAINRGFGGSTLPDVNHYVTRIVCKYQPKKVVLYAGSNDIAELKHSGEQVLENTIKFIDLVHKDCPAAEIYVIPPSVAPCRLQYSTAFDTADKLLAGYLEKAKQAHYIDIISVMRDKKGNLRTDLFGPDNLHMNEKGYALWTPVIRNELAGKGQ